MSSLFYKSEERHVQIYQHPFLASKRRFINMLARKALKKMRQREIIPKKEHGSGKV